VRRKRTAHSAIGELLNCLRVSGDLRNLDDAPGKVVAENQLIQFSGDIDLWPIQPTVPPPAEKGIRALLKWMVFGDDPAATRTGNLQLPRLFTARMPIGSGGLMAIMPMESQYLVAQNARDLTRRVTVVGHVDIVPNEEERLGVEHLAEDSSCGPFVMRTDRPIDESHLLRWMPETDGHWASIRPLCIYK